MSFKLYTIKTNCIRSQKRAKTIQYRDAQCQQMVQCLNNVHYWQLWTIWAQEHVIILTINIVLGYIRFSYSRKITTSLLGTRDKILLSIFDIPETL